MRFNVDLKTGKSSASDFRRNVIAEDEWLPLAMRMRPIIFTESDSIHVLRLTSQIERLHVPLRGRLKGARTGYLDWKSTALSYAQPVGQPGIPHPHGKPVVGQEIAFGPPGVSPSGVDFATLSTDWEYAMTYLNGCLWHSDDDKMRAYQEASADTKEHFQHCAENRVLTAAKYIIPPLAKWIRYARADGHDL